MTEKDDKVDEKEEKVDSGEEKEKDAGDIEGGAGVEVGAPKMSQAEDSKPEVKLTRLNLTGLPVAKPRGVKLNQVQDFSGDMDEAVEIADVRSWNCIFASTLASILCYAFVAFIIPLIGIIVWRVFDNNRDKLDYGRNRTGLFN